MNKDCVFALFFACGAACSVPASADLRQLLVATAYYNPESLHNRVFRMPLEGADAYQLFEFAGPSDGVAGPYAIAVHPATKRLYVANSVTGQILECEINADGTKGAVRIFGTFAYAIDSMAIRPSTGRIYLACHFSGSSIAGIYRMSADGSSFETVVSDHWPDPYFNDDCWIDFDPENDDVIYCTTGSENHIRLFSVDGTDLGSLDSYPAVPDLQTGGGYWLPHHFFKPVAGGGYQLIANTHWVPENGPAEQAQRLLAFDHLQDIFLGEQGAPLILPVNVMQFDYDTVGQKLYVGTNGYSDVYEIPEGYGSYTKILDYPDLPLNGHTRVKVSYGHSVGADTDRDGLTDDDEDSIYGTDPLDADADLDGMNDYAEVYSDGSSAYDPYDPVTNPSGTDTDAGKADTDVDGFSDPIEIAGGSNPLVAGWTASGIEIRVSFQPSSTSQLGGFAPDLGWAYSASRGYGW